MRPLGTNLDTLDSTRLIPTFRPESFSWGEFTQTVLLASNVSRLPASYARADYLQLPALPALPAVHGWARRNRQEH